MTKTQDPKQLTSPRQNRVVSALVLGVLLALVPGTSALAGKSSGGGGTTPSITTNPLAEQAGAKLFVQQDGWYSVSRQSLINAGWDPGTSGAYLQLWADGQQQAMLVNAGTDGSFDFADTVEFYGTALDTPSTGTRVYWLVRGTSQGLRIAQLSAGRPKATAASFNDTAVFTPKTVFASAITTGNPDCFYGDAVSGTPVSEPLTVPGLVASSTATDTLAVSLQGVSQNWHAVSVDLNGHVAGTMSFLGQASQTTTFSVPNSWLVPGVNTVTLVSPNGSMDVSLLASIKLTYPRAYAAVNDTLEMTAGGGLGVKVDGFLSSSIRAFDITTPAAPQQLAVTVAAAGAAYAASFTAPSSQTNRAILAVAASRVLAPSAIVSNTPSPLASTTNQADLVILAHPSMLAAAGPLVSLRRQQGMLVTTVDVTDVYDTFTYGQKDPQAIKTFLQYAVSKWAKTPRYVLLLGGASADARDYLGFGDLDFLPTKLVAMTYGFAASDDWFVDFDNNGLPNLAIGRIPARSDQEAVTAISKIVSYDQQSGSWTKSVLMTANQNDLGLDFESASASVAALLPSTITAQRVFAGQMGASAAITAIVDGFNAGNLIVNYSGHGVTQAWSNSNLFTVASVPSLTNLSQLPFVVSMACLTGSFNNPYFVSLAAAFITAPNGGAVAYWGSSASTDIAGETAINQQLFRLLFNGSRPAVGDAVAQAKAATTDQEVRKSWIFFGDPSMKLAQ